MTDKAVFPRKVDDPGYAPEVLFSRSGAKGRVYVFQDGTQATGKKAARKKLEELREARNPSVNVYGEPLVGLGGKPFTARQREVYWNSIRRSTSS